MSIQPRLYCLVVGERVCVQRRVEQHIERLAMVGGHDIGAVDFVGVDALEERLVADGEFRSGSYRR